MTVLLEGSSKAFFQEPIVSLGEKVTTRASLSSCIAATTVARGDATALITKGNKPWDTWPAILMISEAHGVVTNYQGQVVTPDNCGDIVAAANFEDSLELIKLLNPTIV
jgi:fructose-1,6-bisphosphatase/inositol monophosphatase family enzyme